MGSSCGEAGASVECAARGAAAAARSFWREDPHGKHSATHGARAGRRSHRGGRSREAWRPRPRPGPGRPRRNRRAARRGAPGTIYYGAAPPGGGEAKPVLVFVQGLHGQATIWWTNGNDMYSDAYYGGLPHGLRRFLTDAGGTGGSIWTNGQMLAGQLATIAAHYGVGSVNVWRTAGGGLDIERGHRPLRRRAASADPLQLASPNAGRSWPTCRIAGGPGGWRRSSASATTPSTRCRPAR